MNEDYEFLKLKSYFLKNLKKEMLDVGDGLYEIDNFTLYERCQIELEDIDPLIKRIESQGALKVVGEGTFRQHYVEYPIKLYRFSLDKHRFEKLIIDTDDKISGKIKIRYDEASSTLYINDNKISFTGKLAGSNQADLCKVLLKNKKSINKRWFNDEVLEKWGYEEDDLEKKTPRKVYDAANELNEKIENATNLIVQKFFIPKIHEVSINPKYRSIIKF